MTSADAPLALADVAPASGTTSGHHPAATAEDPAPAVAD
jgi:hypothetical protein